MTSPSPRAAIRDKLHLSLAALGHDFLAVLVLLAIASVSGALLVWHRQARPPPHPRVTLTEMQTYVTRGDVPIIDARDANIYATGHIPTAVSLPFAKWKTRSVELAAWLRRHRDRLVVVYCGDEWCGQAEELQLVLVDLGHTRVGHFAGGFSAWSDAGLAVAHPR